MQIRDGGEARLKVSTESNINVNATSFVRVQSPKQQLLIIETKTKLESPKSNHQKSECCSFRLLPDTPVRQQHYDDKDVT